MAYKYKGEDISEEFVVEGFENSSFDTLDDYISNTDGLEIVEEKVGKTSDVAAKGAVVTSSPGQASESTELEQVDTSLASEDPEPKVRRGRAQVRQEELQRRSIAKEQKKIEDTLEAVELSDSVFTNLSGGEKIKLQDIAVNQIALDYKSQGVKEYDITTEEVDTKATEMLKEKNRPSVVKSYAAQGVRGFASFAKGISEMGETIQYSLVETALDAFNPDYKGTVEEKQAIMGVIKAGGLQAPGLVSLPPSSEIGKFIEKLEPSIRKYEANTITEDIEKGNYLQAGERAVGAAIESLPSIVAAATGVGGLVLLGGSVSGSKFMEEFEADPEKSTGVLLANAGLTGVTEATFELVTRGILSKARLLKDSGADKAATDLIRGGAQKLVTSLGLNSIKEGGSEAATKATTLLLDQLTLGKDIDWGKEVYNIIDEGIVGSVMGSGTTFVGAVANTDKAIVERAQMILTPSKNKQQLIKSANNISKLYKDARSADSDGVKLINEAIKSEELNIVKIKKETAEALNNMTPAELKIYANNQNKLRKLRQQVIDPKTSESVKKLANDKFVQLRNENDVLFQESGKRRIQRGVDVITEAAEKVKGVEVQSFDTTQEVEDFIKQQDPEADVKASQQQGFIVQNPTTGEQTIVVNKEVAGKEKAMNIAGHEFGHAILFKTIKDSPETAENLGSALLSEINKIDAAQVKDSKFKQRLEQYSADGKSVQMEEAITLFSDALATGDIKFNENVFTRIGDQIRRVMQSLGVNVKFNTGRDVYNFVKDYNKSIEKGKIGKAQIKVAKKGVKGTLVKEATEDTEVVIKESKASEELDNKIEALEGSYFNGDIDEYQFEQQKEKLEKDFTIAEYAEKEINEKAEKAAAVEEVETEVVEDVDTKSTEQIKKIDKIVKKATEQKLEAPIVSDKNKKIALVNEDIVKEMTALGANRVSEIEDKDVRQSIVDRLGKNNIGAVKKFAGKAALKGKDLAIDEELKVGYDDFIGGFNVELSALINSYKANEKVPFGAYMNQNLPLRYPATLRRLLEGKLKKSESLSSDKNVKKQVASIEDDTNQFELGGQNDSSEVLEVDQIDVRKFGPAKDKVDEIDKIVQVEEGERPTYKELTNKYLDEVSMELFDVPGKKIKGGATLKDSEAKSLQALFINPNNVRKLFKTMPPYNVAGSETTIGKQGEMISVSKDMKGVSIGMGNKFMKKFYQPVTRAIPGISSPKGRSLGASSQGQVYELKPEFRGRITNEAITDIQRSVGVTEKGVPSEKISDANRSKYGTTLTGFAKAYVANVINIAGRSKQAENKDKKLEELYSSLETSKPENKQEIRNKINKIKKDSLQEQADTGAGKSRLMLSKAIEESTDKEFLDKEISSKQKVSISNSVKDVLVGGNTKDALMFELNDSILRKVEDSKNMRQVLEAMFSEPEKLLSPRQAREFQAKLINAVQDGFSQDQSARSLIYSAAKSIKTFFKYQREIIGYGYVKNKLKQDLKSAKTVEQKIQLVKEFLVFGSRSIRTSKIDGITTNKAIFDKIIKPLIKSDSDLRDFKTFTRKGRSYITYKGNIIKGLSSIYDIKNNFAENIDLVDLEADISRKYIIKQIEEARKNNDIDGVVAMLALLTSDQRGALRKSSKAGFYVDDASVKDYILEHEMEAYEIHKAYVNYAKDGDINKLNNILNNSYVNSIPKYLDKILNAKGVKERNIDRYNRPEFIKELQKLYDKGLLKNIDRSKYGIKFSKTSNLNKAFNDILENKSGIPSRKIYGIVEAITKGSSKGRFNFFIPPSAEDFVGLLYPTLGKGKLGDAQMSWYKKNLIDPYAEAMNKLSKSRIYLMNTYESLKKQLDVAPKDLAKKIKGTDYTREQAVRVYIWNKQKMNIPGISDADVSKLISYVADDVDLQQFGNQLINMQTGDGYIKPKESWPAGTITTDILEGLNTTKRAKYLQTWQENVDVIFSEENLNKLQAIYGLNYRKALVNMLTRMKSGRNRSFPGDSTTGRVTDWLTGSVGTIMFLNTRSAVLQTISAINFVNFTDNNVLAAGKAFANQKQYWADFMKLMNSDFLKERRGGLRINVNEADIADMAKKGGAKGAISKLLELGFAPTQIADSFAIASGGSTFYRNRINTYLKEKDANGNNVYTEKQAEKKAFEDFRETAEESQQSSRADRISMQQASPLGRVVLAFANTPAQYARIIKKAASDLKNGRGDAKTNISKIIYYGFAQNLIFNALQQALFAVGFGDEETEDKEKEKKYVNIANGMLDSILRGSGIGGAIVSVGKNAVIKLVKELEKDRPKIQNVAAEVLKISPPISAKYSRLVQAGKSYDWNKDEMREKGLSLDNPAFLAGGNVLSALTNIPLDRAIKKANNVVAATSQDLETWERLALLGGWQEWELGIKKEDKKKKKKKKSIFKPKKFNTKKNDF